MKTTAYTPAKLPHMGTLIKNRIREQKLSYAEVCRRLDIKQPTMTGYFTQETLQQEQSSG